MIDRLRAVLLAIGCAACAAAPALAADDPCPRAAPSAELVEGRVAAAGPLTIVALGSSSPEGAGASSREGAYPARLERLLRAAFPGRELRVVNAGRSGETSAEMAARLERDVLAQRPDLVLWQAGGNEALRGGEPGPFGRVMEAGLDRLGGLGIPVVLLDNQRSPRLLAAAAERFDAVLAALAARPGVGLFPRGAWQAAAPRPDALIAADALHHNDTGYACLAAALAEALLPALGRPTGTLALRGP